VNRARVAAMCAVLLITGAGPAIASHDEAYLPVVDATYAHGVTTDDTDSTVYVYDHGQTDWVHWTLWNATCTPADNGPTRPCNLFLWGEILGTCPSWRLRGEFRMYEDAETYWSLRAAVRAQGNEAHVALFQWEDALPAGNGAFTVDAGSSYCPRLGDAPVGADGTITFSHRGSDLRSCLTVSWTADECLLDPRERPEQW